MGLGLLLLGYLFCLNLLNVYFLPFAATVMFWALKKLSFVNTSLSRAKFVLIPLFFVGLAGLGLAIAQTVAGEIPYYGELMSALSCLSHAGMLCFLFLLLTGLRRLTDEVKLPVLSFRAVRNRLFCFFYYLPAFLLELPFWKTGLFLQTASLFTVILGVAVFVMNAKLLHDCYRMIGMPDTSEIQ